MHFITRNPWDIKVKSEERRVKNLSNLPEDIESPQEKESNSDSSLFTLHSSLKDGIPIQFKIRHVDHFLPGIITLDDEGYHIHSDAPIQGIAPGQFGCIYDAEAKICYGSGEISIYKDK